MATAPEPSSAESLRLTQDAARQKNWKRWGPYLAERQWSTVREDYSSDGNCWNYFPHDHARSRAYRWGEDGLLGITDRECRLCFALAFWNHQDPILKERLFGLTSAEGNHGEDVKESYFYLDSTPTHSYMRALYRYPQAAFPYQQLLDENRRRSRHEGEFELEDTAVFNDGRFFDIFIEYAKADTDDILIQLTIHNRGPEAAPLTVLPTLWFRNTWSWGAVHEETVDKPVLLRHADNIIEAHHSTLGQMYLVAQPTVIAVAQPSSAVIGKAPSTGALPIPNAAPSSHFDAAHRTQPGAAVPQLPTQLFTDNDTNLQRLFNATNISPYVKDAFHRFVIHNEPAAINPNQTGTKAAFLYQLQIPARGHVTLRLRLTNDQTPTDFEQVFHARRREADEFYHQRLQQPTDQTRAIARQAYAGLLWSKQFYHYIVDDWLKGDPGQPPPPAGHNQTRNTDWRHLYSRDVISMPDKWEYPWFAAWDLAFHCVALAKIDGSFAKQQLELLLREWYMHPNGQIPAYEFNFSDVNPPTHAWAAWRVYKMTGPRGGRDIAFLERCFHKLMLNFTWWVNRKDIAGRHLFAGGFLGLDNIGLFDRSKPLPDGHSLEQADGTAWMAFYCSTMLAIAFELSMHNPAYEDIASKFFEHFVAIVDAINTVGGTGLWDEQDGFYYDHLQTDTQSTPLRVRSLVGIVPLFAAEVFEQSMLDRLPGFTKRMQWFLQNRQDLAKNITYMQTAHHLHQPHPQRAQPGTNYLLAVPNRDRLTRVLTYLLDESEFLSPFGIRSLSKIHKDHPYSLTLNDQQFTVAYCPGESDTTLFGGNSNWRGPIWMPMNFLLIESLERYEHFYNSTIQIPINKALAAQLPHNPKTIPLATAIQILRQRLSALFIPDAQGRRPCMGPHGSPDIPLLFHEYFHGDTGQGLGASHQTGWTAVIANLLIDPART